MENSMIVASTFIIALLIGGFGGYMLNNDEPATEEEHHWGYDGEYNPDNWGHLGGNELCTIGNSQSPIDISTTYTVSNSLGALDVDYLDTPISLVNNGHTVQFNYEEGSTLTFGGTEYELLQFHFHTLSEHTYNGTNSDFEMHMVHKSSDGKYAVIGFMFNIGSEDDFLGDFWDNLPEETEEEFESAITINAGDLVSTVTSYFTYTGSFTTPPCTEGVTWIMTSGFHTISEDQLHEFRSTVGWNFRAVQDLNSREIMFSG